MKEYGSMTDDDGKTYKTVEIGDQIWMAENLNYEVSGSKCYENISANCNTYGRLYDWATAMDMPGCNSTSCSYQILENHRGICPEGWHIPSDADWDVLITAVGGGKYLKAKNGWNNYNGQSGGGQDTYGFSALPGGYGYSGGSFINVGNYGIWWSSTEGNAYNAYGRDVFYDDEDVYRNYDNKSFLQSVRCLQD